MKIIDFPHEDELSTSDQIRAIADRIDSGDMPAFTFAWVADCGDGDVRLGLAGKCKAPAPIAYMMFGVAQKRIIDF